LAALRLRDRDAIVTKEGLIFRVLGYSHPSDAWIYDAEYAPEKLFKSDKPKAYRNKEPDVFYKFYGDEGWKFIRRSFPQYMIFHKMLQMKVLSIDRHDIAEVRKPEVRLRTLIESQSKDELVSAMENVVEIAGNHSGLSCEDFGVFGSMLHGFHHPKFSDIDLVIYGREKLAVLLRTLKGSYEDDSSPLKNEFETDQPLRGKRWLFQNFSPDEFLWHQRRKMIYALFNDAKSGRIIKTEFEPVKDWKEILNEYASGTRIMQKGWVKIQARITEDSDALFIPSVYQIQPLSILNGSREAAETKRVVSYMEEFRLQARKDEAVYIEGNLEEVMTSTSAFYQIALTYCPRYYEQALKVVAVTS